MFLRGHQWKAKVQDVVVVMNLYGGELLKDPERFYTAWGDNRA